MPQAKWAEDVIIKLQKAKLNTGALDGASIPVVLSGFEITMLIDTLDRPDSNLPLFREYGTVPLFRAHNYERPISKK